MAERAAGVALCDVAMPGRDGVWLAGQLRQAYPDTAIIMATASQDVDVALSSLRQGAVDFLAKPFGQEMLRQALARGVRWHRDDDGMPGSGSRSCNGTCATTSRASKHSSSTRPWRRMPTSNGCSRG